MQLGDLLGVGALVTSLGAIVATVMAARRWGNRRRQLQFESRATALMAGERESTDLLKVTYQEIQVDDPHFVSITLRNIGPLDIASGHFDGGKPLVIDLKSRVLGLTDTSHPETAIRQESSGEGVIEMAPRLLPRGAEWVIEAVVEGEPDPTHESPLIDTDIVEAPRQSFPERAQRLAPLLTLALATLSIVSAAVGAYAFTRSTEAEKDMWEAETDMWEAQFNYRQAAWDELIFMLDDLAECDLNLNEREELNKQWDVGSRFVVEGDKLVRLNTSTSTGEVLTCVPEQTDAGDS